MADVATNRRAFHFYEILGKVEAGLILVGTEVKSLRAGRATIDQAYARVRDGEAYLLAADIPRYEQAGIQGNHDPQRPRTLLLHRRQIADLAEYARAKGHTLVPLRLYFRNGYAKVEIGLVRGRQQHDRRAKIRDREMQRDARRATGRRR